VAGNVEFSNPTDYRPSGQASPLWEVLNGTAQEDVNLGPNDVMIQDRVSAGWLVGGQSW